MSYWNFVSIKSTQKQYEFRDITVVWNVSLLRNNHVWKCILRPIFYADGGHDDPRNIGITRLQEIWITQTYFIIIEGFPMWFH